MFKLYNCVQSFVNGLCKNITLKHAPQFVSVFGILMIEWSKKFLIFGVIKERKTWFEIALCAPHFRRELDDWNVEIEKLSYVDDDCNC